MLSNAFQWAFGVKEPAQLAPIMKSDGRDIGRSSASTLQDRSALFRTPSVGSLRNAEKSLKAESLAVESSKQTFIAKPKPQRLQFEEPATETPPPAVAPESPTRASRKPHCSLRRSSPALRQDTLDMLYNRSLSSMEDREIVSVLLQGDVKPHLLEMYLGDSFRAVSVRRQLLEEQLLREDPVVQNLSHGPEFNYAAVQGQCCENVIGYVGVPVGVAGPLMVNGENVVLPMATTEGCLVASTHRGCKAINASGGAAANILSVGMTRAPVMQLPTASRAVDVKQYVESKQGFNVLKEVFDSTSNFARLRNIKATIAGRTLFMRFKSTTGDAMGMNMVSKGTEKALAKLLTIFPDIEVLSLSGNYCTDKKSAAINWIEGRGRSVVCEAVVKANVVQGVLKTTVDRMVLLNTSKNLVGSGMAGTTGGFNAHASNIVTAMFLATGQDVAQNVESSACITLMEKTEAGDLLISVTMPSIEVGTIGGGTVLPAQAACLDIIGVKGPNKSSPGAHADKLAIAIAGAVLAG